MNISKILTLLFLFHSCSTLSLFQKKKEYEVATLDSSYSELDTDDFTSHFEYFEKFYWEFNPQSRLNLPTEFSTYLNSIVDEIQSKNELFFSKKLDFRILIVKNMTPFSFSLPGGAIFLSTGLIGKYITNENFLKSALIFEMIRSEKNLYQKKLIMPTGVLSHEVLLSILRLPTSEKVEIHKWAFFLLKRTGLESGNYLSWLQTINRNAYDFIMQLGDVESIFREEAAFKAFLIDGLAEPKSNLHKTSSKKFYDFIRYLRKTQ